MCVGVRVHAPYKTTYQWGYLHEALEVDGEHKVELLFTPMINQDVHAVFLTQIAQSDPIALHVVVMDQAGFHMKQEDGRVPANIRVLSLPPYCPELNPAECHSGNPPRWASVTAFKRCAARLAVSSHISSRMAASPGAPRIIRSNSSPCPRACFRWIKAEPLFSLLKARQRGHTTPLHANGTFPVQPAA